jgi:DNA-binding IclR family transcriptional regulator
MEAQFIPIYDFIEMYKAKRGYSPLPEEIAEGMGLTKSQIVLAMEAMEELGMIVRPRGYLQAIKLLPRQASWGVADADQMQIVKSGQQPH